MTLPSQRHPVPGSRWILQGLERVITWARMSFKPSKSRSMVLKKGKVVNKFHFSVSGTVIPTITEQPVKSLGKLFDSSLKDSAAIQNSNKNLELGSPRLTSPVCLVDLKPGSTSILSCRRVLWPMLIYAVPMTTVESLERKISGFLRKWLRPSPQSYQRCLYGTSNILQLPFSGLTEEFKVVSTREALQYRDSRDCKVSSAGIEVRTGRKWKAEKASGDGRVTPEYKGTGGQCVDRQSRFGLTSQRPWSARAVARKYTIYSRKRSEQA